MIGEHTNNVIEKITREKEERILSESRLIRKEVRSKFIVVLRKTYSLSEFILNTLNFL
jgi:hypothetical protein